MRRALPEDEEEAAEPAPAPTGTGEAAEEGGGAAAAEIGRATLELHPYSIAVLPVDPVDRDWET